MTADVLAQSEPEPVVTITFNGTRVGDGAMRGVPLIAFSVNGGPEQTASLSGGSLTVEGLIRYVEPSPIELLATEEVARVMRLASSLAESHVNLARCDADLEGEVEHHDAKISASRAALLAEVERLVGAHAHQYAMAGLMLREAEREGRRAKRLTAALSSLVYPFRGRWFVGKHGDTDVTKVVSDLLDEKSWQEAYDARWEKP